MATKSAGFPAREKMIAYSRNPSIKLRNELVCLHSGLVRKVAHQIGKQCAEPYEDLQQIGYLGLIRAIERFDPQQGSAFSSFAITFIRGEMLHYLRDRSTIVRIPRRWLDLYQKGKKLRKQLMVQLGRLPKDLELARALGVSSQEWSECQLAMQNRLLISLDGTVKSMTDGCLTFGDILADPNYSAKQKFLEDRLELEGAMTQLEPKTKAAIEFVFLKDLSRKEAAKHIGVSPITVTRHLRKGMEQLEALLQPQVA